MMLLILWIMGPRIYSHIHNHSYGVSNILKHCFTRSKCFSHRIYNMPKVNAVYILVTFFVIQSLTSFSFLKQHLGASGPETADVEALKLEVSELRQKVEQLQETNTDLKQKVQYYRQAAYIRLSKYFSNCIFKKEHSNLKLRTDV